MKALKSALWEGTEHWDELLAKRAETSGELVLSDFTAQAISKFKSQ
jgi:methylglutaconyl-CoA hydratase